MAELKRRTLYLSTGKQIKLYGNSLAIGPSWEIGEGAAPNIFALMEGPEPNKIISMSDISQEIKSEKSKPLSTLAAAVLNPHQLTLEEIGEIADYQSRLWLDLKDSIRKHGLNNPKLFNRET